MLCSCDIANQIFIFEFKFFRFLVKKLLFILFLIPIIGFGQDEVDSLPANSDSIIYKRLEEIEVYPRVARKMTYKRYTRLIRKIKKVYPFAKAAAAELIIYNEKFINIEDEREKKRYIKKVEKELFEEYEGSLRKLTISEGRYLMLLIDRETGETSYELIKELRGGFPALFWQGIARIFGNDLKADYDPEYKHFVIEQIILMIERGEV